MKSRIRDARQRNEATLAANAERLLNDDSFATLRTRPARVALVVVISLLIIIMVPAWTLGGAIVGMSTVVAVTVGWWLLKLSVRDVADLPDRFLDERQLAVRNQVYVHGARRSRPRGTLINRPRCAAEENSNR